MTQTIKPKSTLVELSNGKLVLYLSLYGTMCKSCYEGMKRDL